MNAKERYLFDLQGYLVVKNVLSAAELKQLNEMVERRQADIEQKWMAILDEQVCRDLIDNATMDPYMLEIVGERYRLDHEYPIIHSKGTKGMNLHGGGTPYDTSMYYQVMNGKIYSGLTVVSYALADLGEFDGGFCCIPGSHKANYPLPAEYRDYTELGSTIHIPQEAGDVLIFSEALTHGTFAWQADHQRRSLLYKYAPAGISWGPHKRSQELLDSLTDKQRAIVSEPASLDFKIHFGDK